VIKRLGEHSVRHLASLPRTSKQNPEYPIGIRQLRSWLAIFHGRQLLTEQQFSNVRLRLRLVDEINDCRMIFSHFVIRPR
jgi:hypothetical protein